MPLLPPATNQRQQRHSSLCIGANRNESIGVADYNRTVMYASFSLVSDEIGRNFLSMTLKPMEVGNQDTGG
ncbi:hypothetical protein H6F86_16405 [Phormidium sp. FACHB-592]|uniref:Uncharacterized protein n=1 Tax=Stenomitos frigidus AS-A4 TaxID=2933935 RepID=A0ABV0KV33_9CYAN|nr:hypothetical protein [Phormidium sp. FACHB-592]MBD2075447.1 hypothetical protein [Phormidium sp. FACHB-592]